MKVSKTTEKYTFYQDGSDYILTLGEIKKGDDTTTELLFEDVEDVTKLSVNKTCGCTTLGREEINKNTLKIAVKYTNCDPTFSKVINCVNNKEVFKIRIKGSCKN